MMLASIYIFSLGLLFMRITFNNCRLEVKIKIGIEATSFQFINSR
jgi:hypothetical protein